MFITFFSSLYVVIDLDFFIEQVDRVSFSGCLGYNQLHNNDITIKQKGRPLLHFWDQLAGLSCHSFGNLLLLLLGMPLFF
jgi:hypothetical protein